MNLSAKWGGALESNGGRYDPFFMGEKCVKVTRGFGYWCWKPQVILQSLRQINDNDILIYADIGCEFVPSRAKSLLQKLKMLESNDIMGFSCYGSNPKYWTKGDIFEFFGVKNDPNFTETPELAGGFIFMKKTQKTIQIMNEFLNIFKNHFNLVDDSPSQTPNFEGFIENRHDQSIWTMINKKHKLQNFSYSNDNELLEKFGIAVSRKVYYTMGHFFDNGNFQFLENPSKILMMWLKIGGKILPSSKARKKCRNLLGLCKK